MIGTNNFPTSEAQREKLLVPGYILLFSLPLYSYVLRLGSGTRELVVRRIGFQVMEHTGDS